MRSLFGCDFNLVVWRFFVCLPSVNNTFIAIICIAATAFRQIKVTPTIIADRFAKHSTRQLIYLYSIPPTHLWIADWQDLLNASVAPFLVRFGLSAGVLKSILK